MDIEMHGEGATAAATNADDDSRAYAWSFWTEWTSLKDFIYPDCQIARF